MDLAIHTWMRAEPIEAAIVTTADVAWRMNATQRSFPYPTRSAIALAARMTMPKPTNPPPVMVPSSVLVKPNWVAQSARIAPRIANPTPATIRVVKLAANNRLLCSIPIETFRLLSVERFS